MYFQFGPRWTICKDGDPIFKIILLHTSRQVYNEKDCITKNKKIVKSYQVQWHFITNAHISVRETNRSFCLNKVSRMRPYAIVAVDFIRGPLSYGSERFIRVIIKWQVVDDTDRFSVGSYVSVTQSIAHNMDY